MSSKLSAKRTERYLNRELSWLRFNQRVLEEAENEANPLLERLKFLAIFESNLDEFYMVRVSGLIEQFENNVSETSADGMTAAEQLADVARVAHELRDRAGSTYGQMLRPALQAEGISLVDYATLDAGTKADLDAYFDREVFPVATPLILSPAPTLPFISNRSLNLAVALVDEFGTEKLARVKVPDVLSRLVPVPRKRNSFVLLEDVMKNNLGHLFPGITIQGSYLFRVIRDADIEIRELEAGDLTDMIEETLRRRRFGDPVLLEIEASAPEEVRETLMRLLKLETSDTFRVNGLLGLSVLWRLAALDRPRLKFPSIHPNVSEAVASPSRLMAAINQGDVLVHHPFDSFKCVEEFVNAAHLDPKVFGIKQTLYRVGTESPIVESLLEAAEGGKQVAVAVELKARFDESNNLVWAKALEEAGAHVTFGVPEIKVHSKLCLIVRREGNAIRTYAHIGTGNYNPNTARLYTDMGLFTSDPDVTQDILNLFNYLTGFSKQREYKKLIVAPFGMREAILGKIRREVEFAKAGKKARLIFKLNSLVDPQTIDTLYEASQAGVTVDLIVRGICCLRPGVKGLSENIRVVSVVGRFLEHSRVLYFENGGRPEAYLGSADLMPRNLDRRVEVFAPIRQGNQIKYVRDKILSAYLKDDTQAWEMNGNGEYKRRPGKTFSAQRHLLGQ